MTNAAYDLSRFDTENKHNPEVKPAQLQVVESSGIDRSTAIKCFALAMFVIAVCSAMLLSMVKINELTNQLSAENAALEKLKSECVILETRLDSEMSLANVEDYAINVLGMKKIETSQMQCITVKTDNIIQTTDNKKNFFDVVSDVLQDLVEYLKF